MIRFVCFYLRALWEEYVSIWFARRLGCSRWVDFGAKPDLVGDQKVRNDERLRNGEGN